MRRRDAMGGLFGAAVSFHLSPQVAHAATALEDEEDVVWPPLPPALSEFADLDATNDAISIDEPHGTERPMPEEVQTARRLLDACPQGVPPLVVARYFLAVGLGDYGEELRPYAGAWPVRWNPVLTEFFTATHTRPVGDTTPWCAAFVNWCLMRSGALGGSDFAPTVSASSGSFRSWGRPRNIDSGDRPEAGDIVVFERSDPVESAVGRGHVGFFLREDDERILVLGGNQSEGSPRRQAINRKFFRKNGAFFKLHSYRTHARLREVRD